MMDFGLEPKKHSRYKRPFLIIFPVLTIAIIMALVFFFFLSSKNPLPNDIKSQINFRVIYPSSKSAQLGASGYRYQAGQKGLTFSLNKGGTNIIFSEQPAPSSVGSGNQVYYQALGLHPYAQFQSKLGPVALAKFYKSGSLQPAGESGVLVSGGTLVIAHSPKNLTNAQWKDLFDSLKITK